MDGEQPSQALLKLPPEQHKLYKANTTLQPDYTLRPGARQMGVHYKHRIKQSLVNLGLYQMTKVTKCHIDKGLITALVERWRPETNTFHLPVGECTVTLEDVSYLWGLPVTGRVVSGNTDDNWSQLILECLGHEVYDGYEYSDDEFYYTKVLNKGEPNETKTQSKYYMRLKWLKDHFGMEFQFTDQETVDRYTRAYCMDLFGSVMFPDNSSSSVPIMYLQFLENLGPRDVDYNWGGAVLACLYRELSRACRLKVASINGPLLLLQMWSWTRFPIGRPRPKNDLPFGDENILERLPFGAKWTIPHEFVGNPVKGTAQYRNQFERLNVDVVNWTPYTSYYQHLPWRGIRDQNVFLCRLWCIHFWEVEMVFPERVMRQFSSFQIVPPPAPVSFTYLENLRGWSRGNGLENEDELSADWTEEFADFIAAAPIPVEVHGPYDLDSYPGYMDWFFQNGMPTVYLAQNNEQILSQSVPAPEGDVGELGYVSDAMIQARTRFRQLKYTAKGITMVKTPGQKAFGLLTLEHCRDTLDDLGHIALFKAMVEKAGLPFDLRCIDISDDNPARCPMNPQVQVPTSTAEDVMAGYYHSLQGILIDGRNLGDEASPSVVPPKRNTRKPNRYSNSRFFRTGSREDEDLL